MKIWSVLVLGLAGLNESQAYRSSWSSWSSWSSNPKTGVRSQKYRNEFKSDMQNKVRGLKMQQDAPSADSSKAKNVKCHTSCTNGNCETKCTKNGKEVSSNEANYQFNYITQPKKTPAKMQHSRKRVQQAPVSTSYSSCTFTCKSGQPCVKTCKGPNAENINMDIKRSGDMKQNVHFDFKVKHQQKNPIANVGNGHGCSYPRVIVGSSCRMPAEQNQRKNMCVKVSTNGRSKTMSITGLISKSDCCCGGNDGTKWGSKKCPRSGSASEENVCSAKAQTGRGDSRKKPEEINAAAVTTESSAGGCAPTTEGYPSSCSGNDSGCPNNECGAENTQPPTPANQQQQRETTAETEPEDSGCSSCDGSCAPEEYNNPTTPGCSGCDSCNSTPTPAPQRRKQPQEQTTESEPGCGECDGSCPDSAEEQATTPGCSGCGGECGATTEPYVEPTREPEVTTDGGCGGGCDGGCDGGCGGDDGGCGDTPNDGGCDGGCNSCGGTQEPYTEPETNEPTTVEPTTVEPTAAPTTPTREREPETTVPDIAEQTEELPEEIPDYSGSYSDENQVYPKPQVQVEELEREASSSCGRGDTDCELPAAVHNQGADQNECSGENCGEPVDVSADCLDCHVENKDIPGGSENAQFLQDLGCRGSNCDLANAYLENTTGEILMTTGGIPGTAAPTGPRTKTPRPSPPPTSPYDLTTPGQFGMLPTDDFLYEPVQTLERVNNYPDDQELSAIARQAPAQRPNRAEAAERESEIVSKNYEVFEMPLNKEGVCEQSNSFGEVFITSANSVTEEECCCAAYLNNKGLLDQSEAKSVNRAFNSVDCPLPKSAGYRKLCPAKMGVAKYSYENQPRKLRDINECDLFEACGVSGICQNFKKSYSCDCFKNYKFNPVSMKCEQSVQIKSCFVGRIDDNRQRIKVNNFIMPGFEHVSSRNMNTCGRNLGRHSKEDCCCGPAFDDLFNMPGSVDPNKGGNGKYSWGSNCKACPNRGTSAHRRLCM